MVSYESATETIRPPSEMEPPARPFGYPLPSKRSWCSTIASAQGPSHPRMGSAILAPSTGWPFIRRHSCSSSAPGLLRICGAIVSFPMSCINAAHRRRYRSATDSWSSSPRRSVKTRTRSACPRVRRSWDCRATERDRIVSAVRASSRDAASSCVSASRASSRRTLPAVRATENRLGAWSGKSIESFSSVTKGRSRRAARSMPTATSNAHAKTPAAQTNHHPPSGDGTSRRSTDVAPSDAAIGTSRMKRRSPAARAGCARQVTPVGVGSPTLSYRAPG